MKKTILITVILVFMVLETSFGHPPVNVALDYDKAGELLHIVVFHPVEDPTEHNISVLEIEVNGRFIKNVKVEGQDDNAILRRTIEMKDVKKGDLIKVIAKCNNGGETSGEKKVE